jgi:hypothetical protein
MYYYPHNQVFTFALARPKIDTRICIPLKPANVEKPIRVRDSAPISLLQQPLRTTGTNEDKVSDLEL